jgi:hypothetical protein
MRAAHKLHEVTAPHSHSQTLAPQIPLQQDLQSAWWERWFMPHREERSMSEEAAKSGGLWMPYPLLGILLSLVLVLGGGIIGLYSTVTTMNATMLMRDSDYRERMAKQETQVELLKMYVADDRKVLAVLEDRVGKKKLND